MKKYHLHWSKSPNRELTIAKFSKTLRKQFKNGRKVWCEGTKGICKPNSGSFKKGLINHWNKGRTYKNTVGYGNWKDGRTKNKKEYSKYLYKKNIVKYRNKARIALHNRRLKGGHLTKETMQMVYEDNIKRFGTLTCYLCLKSIGFGKDSLDHKVPICRGGKSEYSNLGIAHRYCNSQKNWKSVEEYREYIKING